MFDQHPHCIYRNNQITQVVCQFRFPKILSIQANLPVDFQEAIRGRFPQFSSRKELPPQQPTLIETLSGIKPEPITNYQFTSEDGAWRINLTGSFISLSTTHYHSWEEFAQRLDTPLAAFFNLYKPAYFERLGIRYVNAISRKQLGLEGTTFSQLIKPCYLGPMSEADVKENAVLKNSIDTLMTIPGGRVKIHAGPGLVRVNGKSDPEVKFIFDQDLYLQGNIPLNTSLGTLDTLHAQAYNIFRNAITDQLHQSMEPEAR